MKAEEAAGPRNMRELYNISRQLSGRRRRSEKPIKDERGYTLFTKEKQMKRWVEQFEEHLNCPPPATQTDIPPVTDVLPMKLSPPKKEEIKKAITSLQNGKAAAPDTIPSEALKSDTNTNTKVLHPSSEKRFGKKVTL